MKKNKFNEQSAQVLNLGNLHEEIQQHIIQLVEKMK